MKIRKSVPFVLFVLFVLLALGSSNAAGDAQSLPANPEAIAPDVDFIIVKSYDGFYNNQSHFTGCNPSLEFCSTSLDLICKDAGAPRPPKGTRCPRKEDSNLFLCPDGYQDLQVVAVYKESYQAFLPIGLNSACWCWCECSLNSWIVCPAEDK